MNATNSTTPGVDSEGKKLPPIRTIGDIVKHPPRERPEVIKGILKKSSKMGFSGPSKARKTWQLMNLAISVTTGHDWLKFETVKTKVLYINLELHEDTFFHRLGLICEAMETPIAEISTNMSAWCLRRHAAAYTELVPQILNEVRDKGFGLIIFDPTYKILGDSDENKSNDITKLMNSLESISFETGAAFVMAYHFSKGSKDKAQDGDKTSGSGVFFRDPEALIEFSPQADADDSNSIMSVTAILRDFAPVPKFSIEWDSKALFNVSGHDPSKLKKAGVVLVRIPNKTSWTCLVTGN
jgi:regulatory protein RepA